MRRSGFVILTIAAVAAAYFLLPKVISPSGTWTRRELREHPLVNPTQASVDDDGAIHLLDGRKLSLAGILLPDDADLRRSAVSFLRVCVRQGIVVEKVSNHGHAMLRCEPRVYHWCGNDPVSADYQQWILNELILAAGLAHVGPEAGTPDESTLRRLRGAQRLAWSDGLGVWAQADFADEFRFDERQGLNISSVTAIRQMDEAIEDALAWPATPEMPD